jgi:hypothetical protein
MINNLKSIVRSIFPLAITVSTIAFFSQCNFFSDHYKWKGGVIRTYGNYFIDNSDYVISVGEEEGLLKYKVFGKDSSLLIASKEHASVYQTWIMYWDTANTRLWIQSSDIGFFVWERPKKESNFEEKEITAKDKDLIKTIPVDFFNLFPSLDKEFCKKNGYKGGG